MTNTIRILLCSAASAVALAMLPNAAHAVAVTNPAVTSSGVYDPASASLTNNVDFNAPGIPITAGTGNGAVAPVGAFNTAITAAFAAGRGGVIDFDGLSTSDSYTGMNVSYAGGNKSLSIGTSSTFLVSTGAAEEDGSPTSNTQYGETHTANSFTFSFNSITGASPGETGVAAVGITMLSGNLVGGTPGFNFGPVTVTAQFSDSSTFAATRTISEDKGDGDTFYSAVAPAGLNITSLLISSSNQFLIVPEFDDLAFATSVLPEPASLALLGLCASMLLGRSRRAISAGAI